MQYLQITKSRRRAALLAGALAGLLLGSASCVGGRAARAYRVNAGGDADRGIAVINMKNCGSCHSIPGIHGARGIVGPPLTNFARRTFIAGEAPNQPDKLAQWLMSPQSIEPHTAMPNLGLTEQQARDVAAYLYTLE